MEGVGYRVRARLGVGRWLAVTEGVPSVLWPTGLLREKTLGTPRNKDGAASFSYRSTYSPFKAVTLSLLEPSEVWTMEGESALGRTASSPLLSL